MAILNCPNCKTAVDVVVSTEMMDEQTLYFVINYTKGALLHAKTIWDTIRNFEILMKASAKEQGEQVNVWIRDITNLDGELKIQFVLTNKKLKG